MSDIIVMGLYNLSKNNWGRIQAIQLIVYFIILWDVGVVIFYSLYLVINNKNTVIDIIV